MVARLSLPRIGEAVLRHLGWPVSMELKGWWYGISQPRSYVDRFAELARADPVVWRLHQEQRLAEQLSLALDKVPFFAPWRHLRSEIATSPRQVLAQLPVIDKRVLLSSTRELEVPDVSPRRRRPGRSGGSTGEPSAFIQDRRALVIRHASLIPALRPTGWRPAQSVAFIWGSYDGRLADSSLSGRLRELVMHGVVGALDAFHLEPEKMARFFELLERRRPALLFAYPSAADHFTRWLESEGLSARARQLGCKAIISSAETLLPNVRARLEAVFACPVFDNYGTSETGLVAFECDQHHGLHVTADSLIVELVNEQGEPVAPGEPGRVVVTDLWNRCFAFLRYDLGDVARWRQPQVGCPCGVTYPLLDKIEGRQTDLFVAVDGGRVHGELVSHLLHAVDGIDAFQMTQHSLERFTLRIVGDRDRVERSLPAALDSFRQRLPGAWVEVVYGEAIPVGPRGKRRFTISEITERDQRPSNPANARLPRS